MTKRPDPTPPANGLGGSNPASRPLHPKFHFRVEMPTLSSQIRYNGGVARASDKDRLGLFRTIRQQPSGRSTEQNLSGFVLRNRQGAIANGVEIACTQERHVQANRLVNQNNHFRCDPHPKVPQGKWINAAQVLPGHPVGCRKTRVGRFAYDTGAAIKDLISSHAVGWGLRVGVLCQFKTHI